MGKICCFTGYRPHRFGFSTDGLRPEQVQKALSLQIKRLYNEGHSAFITGMCLGVDLWAAQEVLALRQQCTDVRLIAAVPFEGQESHWSQADKRLYRSVLSACDEVETLFDREEAIRDPSACYRQRNRWMVDRAETVLAVYALDGQEFRSGTAATVRYARRLQRRILYIHPQTLSLTEETVQQIQFTLE